MTFKPFNCTWKLLENNKKENDKVKMSLLFSTELYLRQYSDALRRKMFLH